MIKVAILTNIIPVYREGFYERLLGDDDMQVTIFCQSRVHGMNYNTIHDRFQSNVHLMKFVAAKNEKLVWQFIPFFKIAKNYDVIFIDGNPRIVSQAIFATILRLFNKKVVIWSMVHSYRNNVLTENIRIFWLNIFKYHFLYNDADVDILIEKGFKNKLMIGMNNGLNQKKIDKVIEEWPMKKLNLWREDKQNSDKVLIVSSGRLVNNKYDDLVEALPTIASKIPNILWVIIGDGPEREKLESKIKKNNLSNLVCFVGEIYDDNKITPWLLSSQIFVHPYAVGLSIMQAFGYGLPIITHHIREEHGPEFVAFEEKKTGYVYQKNNIQDLSNIVVHTLQNNTELQGMKKYVQGIAREKYNVDVMYQRFKKMVLLVKTN